MTDRDYTRREFLRVTGRTAFLSALASFLTGQGPGRILFAQATEDGSDVAFVGFDNGADDDAIARRVEEAIRAVDDLSWLSSGDTVAVKIASNSALGYPKTTHPEVLEATIRILRERGANVVVADQAGLEWVAPGDDDERIGRAVRSIWGHAHSGTASGMEVLERNGLADATREAGAEIRSFDRDADYVRTGPTEHWPDGFRIARLYEEADHVVNLARPSGHVMLGHTATVKNWYGWLHPMDRLKSHTDLGFDDSGDRSGRQFGVQHLHERVAEVASAFQGKTRLHIVGAIDSYADIGPDWGTQPLRSSGIIASKDMLAADAATAALVASEKHRLSREERAENWEDPVPWWKFWEAHRNESFWGSVETRMHDFHGTSTIDELAHHPTDGGIWDIETLRHGEEIGLGDADVVYRTHGEVDPAMLEDIRELTGGTDRPADLRGLIDVIEEETGQRSPEGER